MAIKSKGGDIPSNCGFGLLHRMWKTCYVKARKRPISMYMSGDGRNIIQLSALSTQPLAIGDLGGITSYRRVILAMGMFVFTVIGCETGNTITIQVTDQRSINPTNYSRIEIPQEHLEAGLSELLRKMSEQLGPIESESIIQNYSPIIQEGLYRSGYCSIQKLNINGSTVDIDVYFRTGKTQPVLIIDAYLQGGLRPSYSVANHYFASKN